MGDEKMFNYLLLYGLQQLKGQRSTASLYHILMGRRSTQTIQDAHFYHMTQFYAIYPKLKREDFERAISHLVKQNYLEINKEGMAKLLIDGEKFLKEQSFPKVIASFKGIEAAKKTAIFSQRLLLTIQTFTNLAVENNQFQPISDDLAIQQWVKDYYKNNSDLKSWLRQTYDHLMRFLASIDELQATIFASRLSGYRKYGQSIQQLASKHQLSVHDINLSLVATFHQLVDYIEVNQINILIEFIPVEEQQTNKFVTQSAKQTYQLLKKGYTIDQVMRVRRLKRSTIEDHIIELTYAMPNFNLSAFINEKDLQTITERIQDVSDLRLSSIKKQLDDKFDYFQIRLAMAKVNQ